MKRASETIVARLIFKGRCHCGAIGVELISDRPPAEQALGVCQCSFCRKHNARAFSDPKADVTLTANDPDELQRSVCERLSRSSADGVASMSQ
jgi:hypothetical protein